MNHSENPFHLSTLPSDKLDNAILVAVWPGMGQIAATAGYYLMSQLGMQELAEFPAQGLFDVDSITVQHGIIQPSQRPRSRIFSWRAPKGKRDILVFIGEAQPPLGKYEFCQRLVDCATSLGATQIVTFAAMASTMHLTADSRVFAAATDEPLLDEITLLGGEPLGEGNIGGMNGVLLGVAADRGIPGLCLLGEMPHSLVQLAYPKGALTVLRTFSRYLELNLNLKPLVQHTTEVDKQLEELMSELRARQALSTREPARENQEEEDEEEAFSAASDEALSREDAEELERLFRETAKDRSKAYDLKRELDRLGVFEQYEDRFLDLFRKSTDS